jgi:predicted nucleic acid-binding protein
LQYIVLDTNIASYLHKRSEFGERYRVYLEGKLPCLAFQSVAELYQWAEARNWGERRRSQLESDLHQYLVLPYDNETAAIWARVRVECSRVGRPVTCEDAWVAACALRHYLPLVTHNPKHFEQISGLDIVTVI